jgi:hypothetical protein
MVILTSSRRQRETGEFELVVQEAAHANVGGQIQSRQGNHNHAQTPTQVTRAEQECQARDDQHATADALGKIMCSGVVVNQLLGDAEAWANEARVNIFEEGKFWEERAKQHDRSDERDNDRLLKQKRQYQKCNDGDLVKFENVRVEFHTRESTLDLGKLWLLKIQNL